VAVGEGWIESADSVRRSAADDEAFTAFFTDASPFSTDTVVTLWF
jgi:hypothetical protein